MNNDILVALSGGMDSAAAVLKLRGEGFRPVGLYIDMLGDAAARRHAEETAERLGIELFIENCETRFRHEVSDYFVRAYLAGQTPAPCSQCNPSIKWKITAEVADRIGIEKIATGHYCQTETVDNQTYITRGADPAKDQSYYLWGLGPEILRRAVFPLGGFRKQEVRQFLTAAGYSAIERQRESMSVCFLGGGGYENFIRQRADELGITITEGNIVDTNEHVVARHRGLPFYTIGQKRGIDGGQSVIGIDASTNRIIVGSNENLYTNTLIINDWQAINIDELLSSSQVAVMVRGIGRNPEGYAEIAISQDEPAKLIVRLENPAWAIAAGQPAVFYIGNRVVGGGIMEGPSPVVASR